MSVLRSLNLLSQGRIDIPTLRQLDSSVQADFDLGFGSIVAGKSPVIINGFNIPTSVSAIGNPATNLTVNVAGGQLIHYNASDAGSIFSVDPSRTTETLVSTNSRVVGSFVASSSNYVGLDLIRSADSSTSDTVQFINPITNVETAKSVPLARTLDYKIIIQAVPFSSLPNICPIGIVVTDANLNVSSIQDARKMMFRLGAGGDAPNALAGFAWSSRTENPITSTTGVSDPFVGADKSISALKPWMDAVMTRIWEGNGGEYWYSQTHNNNIRLIAGDPQGGLADNIEFNGTQIRWSGFSVIFNNSTAITNIVPDVLTFSSSTNIPDKNALYVDLNRAQDGATITWGIAPLATLGDSSTPGSRFVIAWRLGSRIHQRNKEYYVGKPATVPVATSTVVGGAQSNISNGSSPGLGTTLATTGGATAGTPVFPLIDTGTTNSTQNSVIAAGLTRGKTSATAYGFPSGTLLVGGGGADSIVNISTAAGGALALAANARSGSINILGSDPGANSGNASIFIKGASSSTTSSPDVVIASSNASRPGNTLEIQNSTYQTQFSVSNAGAVAFNGALQTQSTATFGGAIGAAGPVYAPSSYDFTYGSVGLGTGTKTATLWVTALEFAALSLNITPVPDSAVGSSAVMSYITPTTTNNVATVAEATVRVPHSSSITSFNLLYANNTAGAIPANRSQCANIQF